MGCPDHQAHVIQPVLGVLSLCVVDNALGDGVSAMGGELHFLTLRIAGVAQHEQAPAGGMRQVDGGAQGLESQVGTQGDRIGAQLRVIGQVCAGVGGHRRADVTALHVEDRQGPGGADVVQDPTQCRHPARSEHLEEGTLRLEDHHLVGQRGDGVARQAFDARGVVVQAPGPHQGLVGIQADAQASPLVSQGLEARPETAAHARAPLPGRVSRLMPITSAGPSKMNPV